MVFLGIGKKKLTTEAIGSKCTNCNSDELMIVDVFARYFGILWIPVLPLGKKVQVTCPKCGHQPELQTLPQPFVLECEQLKDINTSPRYLFTGSVLLMLVAVFFIFRSLDGVDNGNNVETYLHQPERGDVYEIKTDDGKYSLLKILEVKEDSLFVVFHNGETENKSELKTLMDTKNFSREMFAFSKEQIIINYDDGLILNIIREGIEEEVIPVSDEEQPIKSKEVEPAKQERKVTSKNLNRAAPADK